MGTVIGFVTIGGITVAATIAEQRLSRSGYTNDAKVVRTFNRTFLLGAGVTIVCFWVREALRILLL